MARSDERGLSSNSPAGDDRGDDAAREQPRAPTTNGPDVQARRPDMVRAAREGAQAIGAAIGEDATFGGPGEQQAMAVGDEAAVAREAVEAATVLPGATEPDTAVKTPALRRPVPEPPLPLADPPTTATEADDQPQALQSRAGPAPAGEGTAAPAATLASGTDVAIVGQAPRPASGTDVVIAGQTRRVASETGLAGAGRYGSGPSALPPDVRATRPAATSDPFRHSAPADGDQVALAAEPRHSLAAHEGADGGDRVRPREMSVTPDGPSGAQARAADPSARQQPVDVQPGRLPQISGLAGTVATSHPATGMPVELAQLVARAPDGTAAVEPGPHPATRQIMLQITRGLDQERTEIRIRLDPPDLGEVDIQLEFRDLRLTASISAERADTLDLLQRDARALARALREAGLELADSDLSFAASGRDDRPAAGSYAQRTTSLPRALSAGAAEVLPLPPAIPAGFVSLSDGRMDLRA